MYYIIHVNLEDQLDNLFLTIKVKCLFLLLRIKSWTWLQDRSFTSISHGFKQFEMFGKSITDTIRKSY